MTDTAKPDARVIPGLGALGAPPGSKASKRSRPKSSAQPKAQGSTEAGAGAAGAASSNLKESHKPANLALNPDALLVPQLDSAADLPPRVPASVIVAKRVKALQKKLVRLRSCLWGSFRGTGTLMRLFCFVLFRTATHSRLR